MDGCGCPGQTDPTVSPASFQLPTIILVTTDVVYGAWGPGSMFLALTFARGDVTKFQI